MWGRFLRQYISFTRCQNQRRTRERLSVIHHGAQTLIATVLNQQLGLCQVIIEGSSVLPQVLEIIAVKYVVGLGFHMLFESCPVFVKFVSFFTAQVPCAEQV